MYIYMKITKRQLRKLVREATRSKPWAWETSPADSTGAPDVVGAITGVPGGNIQNLVDEYKVWAVEYMGTPSGANSSSVLATFLVDQGLDQGPMADNIMKDMAREMRFDIVDVRRAVGTAREEYGAGGALSDQEIHDRGFMEGKLKITKRQLRRIIKEAFYTL